MTLVVVAPGVGIVPVRAGAEVSAATVAPVSETSAAGLSAISLFLQAGMNNNTERTNNKPRNFMSFPPSMSLQCKYFTARRRFSLAMTRFALLLILLAAPAALAVDVEGYVYTPDGTPVAKAAVTAGSHRATTSDDGHFKISAPAD